MDKSFGDEQTLGPAPKSGGHTYALKPGDLFGQYRVIRVLGAGGMGEVYEVEHEVLRRTYALKLLPSTLDWQGVSLERFRREAQVMANLDHPNILKVDEFGETDDRYWLRMEIAGGLPIAECRLPNGNQVVSLQDLAEAHGGKIPQEELLPILRQVLEGLQYAHSHGAIHRDLKPSNILLKSKIEDRKSEIVAVISDFGLVRLVGEDWVRSQAQLSVQRSLSMGDEKTKPGAGESKGTSTRALLGTYEYMSPEQKRGEEADERSDLYAVGLMAYRLLTGRSLLTKMPSRMGFDNVWDDLIESALEEDKSERTPTCAVMLQQLTVLYAGNAEPQLGPKKTAPVVAVRAAEPPPLATDDDDPEPGTERALDIGEGVELTLCWIPATTSEAWKKISGGKETFTMGSPENELGRWEDEGPQREVTISCGLWMGKYPVTQGQYEKVMEKNPSFFKSRKVLALWGGKTQPDHPVEWVGWDLALAFCNRLKTRLQSEFDCRSIGLPTEAEWEYACRAGTTTAYYTGDREDDLVRAGWYGWAGGRTHPVGEKMANAWGLCDMHGNVWEWCQDGWQMYSVSEQKDPGLNDTSGASRVLRGGSWYDNARLCRSASRDSGIPRRRNSGVGFRVVFRP